MKGKLEQVKVLRSSLAEMDQKALEAVGNWIFKPGRKNGLPVPVQISVEVDFRLY
jgi:protein TonB